MRLRPLSFLALLLLVPTGSAAQEDLAWRVDERRVSLVSTGDGFQFSSLRDSGLGRDAFTGTFSAATGRLDARFAASEPEPSDLTMAVAWRSLVEYRDADGDGRFGLADPVVQRITVASLPSATVVAPTLGGQSASVEFTLPGNESGGSPLPVPGQRGVLRLGFTLVPRPAGADLAPTDLGLSVEVRDFPYRADDTDLALVSDVSTASSRLDRDPSGVSLAAGRLTLGLEWAQTAQADGSAQPAPATAVSDQANEATFVQSLPRGDSVRQDGSVSTHRWSLTEALGDLPRGDWRFYALGVAVAVLGLGIPSVRRLREA